MSDLLKGKNVVVMGIANERSIAWGITKSLHNAGANLIFTSKRERSYKKLVKLLDEHKITPKLIVSCDTASDDSIQEAFAKIKDEAGVIHGLVHSIAFARGEDLEGEFTDISRDGFLLAQEISAYSLIAVTRAAKELMTEGGSIVTQTYLGSERILPNFKYNVMGAAKAALEASVRYLADDVGKYGIRVNAVSAGIVPTFSSKVLSGVEKKMSDIEEKAPLRRGVDQDEVGDATLFFISDLSRSVTGEILHVDAGFHIIGG